jgi:Ser/Thr protein kinase RdoA (MazF antagonist)
MKNDKRYYLRFNKNTEREWSWIMSEIEVLQALEQSGVQVNQPIYSRFGNLIETIHTNWGTYFAVVFTGLPGYEWDPEQLTDQQLILWGAAVGQFHKASSVLPKSITEKRPHWRQHLDWAKSWLDPNDEAAHEAWTQIAAWASCLDQNNRNFGLIHTDLELDNIRWNGTQFGLIDMDECQQGWYVMDIWQAVSDLTEDQICFEHPKLQLFLKGY